MKIFNHKSTREKRKLLRGSQAEAEKELWKRLRNKSFLGLKFFRQYGIGHYIADFYCPQFMIAIEIDGEGHFSKDGMEYDKERDGYFAALGIRTLRLSNTNIFENIEEALRKIETFKGAPSFLKRGYGGVKR